MNQATLHFGGAPSPSEAIMRLRKRRLRHRAGRTAPACARIRPCVLHRFCSVVCLPGLARTVTDFDGLGQLLANGQAPRRVLAIDSRGRGLSEYDRNPENYNVAVELGDVITTLTALDVGPAVFVGSSRGGILTMLLGVAHPTAIAGAVLHDIGPVIEQQGLVRIKGYVGKLPQPRNYTEGAEILRRLFSAQFPRYGEEQWRVAAQRTWKTDGNALTTAYDVRLAQTLASFDTERPLRALWNEFDSLSHVPLLVIRGANSDILSVATANEMAGRHPGMELIEVADEGHVPQFDRYLCDGVAEFAAKCDGLKPRRPD